MGWVGINDCQSFASWASSRMTMPSRSELNSLALPRTALASS